jgi:hypothetical protein
MSTISSSAGLVERDFFTDMGGMGFESAMSAGLNSRRRSNDELFQDFEDGQLLRTLQRGLSGMATTEISHPAPLALMNLKSADISVILMILMGHAMPVFQIEVLHDRGHEGNHTSSISSSAAS